MNVILISFKLIFLIPFKIHPFRIMFFNFKFLVHKKIFISCRWWCRTKMIDHSDVKVDRCVRPIPFVDQEIGPWQDVSSWVSRVQFQGWDPNPYYNHAHKHISPEDVWIWECPCPISLLISQSIPYTMFWN